MTLTEGVIKSRFISFWISGGVLLLSSDWLLPLEKSSVSPFPQEVVTRWWCHKRKPLSASEPAGTGCVCVWKWRSGEDLQVWKADQRSECSSAEADNRWTSRHLLRVPEPQDPGSRTSTRPQKPFSVEEISENFKLVLHELHVRCWLREHRNVTVWFFKQQQKNGTCVSPSHSVTADGNFLSGCLCSFSINRKSNGWKENSAAERETLRSEADKHPLKTTENFQPAAKNRPNSTKSRGLMFVMIVGDKRHKSSACLNLELKGQCFI